MEKKFTINSFCKILGYLMFGIILLLLLPGCNEENSSPSENKVNFTKEESALIPVAYFHKSDSDGWKTNIDSDVILFFEPGGKVQLYLAKYDEAQASSGTYSFENDKIRLKIDDLAINALIQIDTSKDEITLPFKLYNEGEGTSVWKKNRLPIAKTLMGLFNSINLSESLTVKQVMERVGRYADAITKIQQMSKPSGVSIQAAGEPALSGFTSLDNAYQLDFQDGTTLLVELYNFFNDGPALPLTPGMLSGDPRVHLQCSPPNAGLSDPPEKTALFIAPFDTINVPAWKKDASGKLVMDGTNTLFPFGEVDKLEENAQKLTKYGYTCNIISNNQAGIDDIIRELLPGGGRAASPGLIYFSTHGFENGTLISGYIYQDEAKLKKEIDDLEAQYPDLFTYDGGTRKNPKTLTYGNVPHGWRPKDATQMVTITPKFWEWLKTKGADFSRSMIYVSACLTDKTPLLRNAIKSRAYFAYNISVCSNFAAAVFKYMCTHMTRPTHSAEEAYYNIIRIANTQQMIYKEDAIFQGAIPKDPAEAPKTVFKGYASDGNTITCYQDGGWMKTADADPGVIWWLVFGCRWGQDAKSGLDGMYYCWYNFWKDGEAGGLANPGCNSKTTGRCPTKSEIAYAAHLILGDPSFDAPGVKRLPRFTLFDGRQ